MILSKSRIAFLQFDERTDNNIKEISEINKKYCNIHGYNYIFKVITDEDLHHDLDDYFMIDGNKEDEFRLKIYDYRIKMIEQYMNDYDYLFYLDTDAVIYNPIIKIEDLIDNEHMFFMFHDVGEIGYTYELIVAVNKLLNYCKMIKQYPPKNLLNTLLSESHDNESLYHILCKVITNIQGIASGIIIVNCHHLKLNDFIKDFKRFYPIFQNCLCDQGCIQTLFRRKKYCNLLKIMPIELHGNPFFNNRKIHGIENYALTDKAFICHFYGESNNKEQCKEFIEQIKCNKWWNNIN